MGLLCDMNVISTTIISCSVATSSSESLPNDGEKAQSVNQFLFPKCDYDKISVKPAF